MFTTKEEKKAADEITNSSNVIGKGTVLEGNIEASGNIRIEGRIIGNIKSKSKVALGNSCVVDGNVSAQNADIEGTVKGKVEIADLLVLKATGMVQGDIITGKLVVEPGAVFNGTCKMGAAVKDIKSAENAASSSFRSEAAV
ncbi:MAG: polymer-forming cytoskeletal protein [Cyclobacteriaceae bacterium]|nr:polymer-forming cytoskeletal protein [Cyclobacteriaceae bacterium]